MADLPSESPPLSGFLRVGTDDCPRVAELICYALGQAIGEECRRIEAHLKNGDCDYCRRWIENASRHRPEPSLDPDKSLDPSAVFTSPRPAVASPSDRTPIPPSARWQRQVFVDLERRLTLLEESSGG